MHFEQCTHNKLPHNDLLIKLSHIAKKNKIDPVLIKLIQRHFLNKAVDEKTLYIDEPTIRWKRYRMVLRTQQVIGWNKLQRGFFSVEWDHLQWRYERTIQMEDTHDALWIRPVMKLIFSHHKKRWKHRNDKEHDGDGVKEKQNLIL